MKKIVAFILFATVFGSVIASAGNKHADPSGAKMEIFTPTSFATYSSTKAAKTHTVSNLTAIRFQPSAAITYKLNGTGQGYPVAANTNEGPFGTARLNAAGVDVTSIVFYVTSSATKTKIYVQNH